MKTARFEIDFSDVEEIVITISRKAVTKIWWLYDLAYHAKLTEIPKGRNWIRVHVCWTYLWEAIPLYIGGNSLPKLPRTRYERALIKALKQGLGNALNVDSDSMYFVTALNMARFRKAETKSEFCFNFNRVDTDTLVDQETNESDVERALVDMAIRTAKKTAYFNGVSGAYKSYPNFNGYPYELDSNDFGTPPEAGFEPPKTLTQLCLDAAIKEGQPENPWDNMKSPYLYNDKKGE